MGERQVGARTKEKLRKVIEWVQQAGSTLQNVQSHGHQHKGQQSINWKVQEERCLQDCFSLLEVSSLTDSSEATFCASVGEIFLPLTWKHLPESEEERMFISRRLCTMGDKYLAEDLICSGCQLCGSPLNSELGSTCDERTTFYCQKSANHLHIRSVIYRPFMLYVWDDSKYIPLLVKNKAAELLFGNIKAESLHSCYTVQEHGQPHNPCNDQNADHFNGKGTTQLNAAEGGSASFLHPSADKSLGKNGKKQSGIPDFYSIWLILLKLLMQQGKDSPLKFKVTVNVGKDWDRGRFEMVSVSMPCF